LKHAKDFKTKQEQQQGNKEETTQNEERTLGCRRDVSNTLQISKQTRTSTTKQRVQEIEDNQSNTNIRKANVGMQTRRLKHAKDVKTTQEDQQRNKEENKNEDNQSNTNIK
jgi:hypothetical protein